MTAQQPPVKETCRPRLEGDCCLGYISPKVLHLKPVCVLCSGSRPLQFPVVRTGSDCKHQPQTGNRTFAFKVKVVPYRCSQYISCSFCSEGELCHNSSVSRWRLAASRRLLCKLRGTKATSRRFSVQHRLLLCRKIFSIYKPEYSSRVNVGVSISQSWGDSRTTSR